MKQVYPVALAVLMASTCLAAKADDFYAENDLSIVVGFSAGGAFDSYARLLARHLGNHIPGNPSVIVQNMPGAGGLTAVRHLDTIAPTDGSVIVAFNSGHVLAGLVDPETVPVDFRDYTWLGSASRSFRVCYTWSSSGIEDWDDLVARDEVNFGFTAPGSGAYIDAATFNNVFDVNITLIPGYPGAAEIDHALELGEVDINCNLWAGVSQTWRESDDFIPLVKLAEIDDPDLSDDLPFLGALATTDEQSEILDLIFASHSVGVPYILSRDVPEERAAILREAFEATVNDPAFLADAESMSLPVIGPLSGSEAEAVVDGMYGSDPELVESVKAAVEM